MSELEDLQRSNATNQVRIAELENLNKLTAVQAACIKGGFDFFNATSRGAFEKTIAARVSLTAAGPVVDGVPLQTAVHRALTGDFAHHLKPKGGAGGGMPSGSKTFSMDDIKPDMTIEQKRAFRDVLIGLNSPYVKR